MRFEDFVLQLDASARGGFRARVLKSPFGEGTVGFALPAVAGMPPGGSVGSAPGAAVSRDIEHTASSLAQGERPPVEIGTEIFRSVFQGQVRSLLDKSRGHLERSPDLGLRLKIKLDPADADTAALSDLPWELLCDGETEEFFALSRQTSLVRYLDVPRSSQPIAFTPPLRILAVGASPSGLPPLDLAAEVRHLEALHRSASGVEVQFLSNASAGAVREALSGDRYNVLHFMGHGTFDRATGEGMLAFEGAEGRLDLVSGKAFATKLRDFRSLGVVVLNACNTARTRHQPGSSSFRGVATALVLGGVPAVVAMQRPISDRAAIGFSGALYRHLARGDSIDEALTEGRQAIHSAEPEAFEWATPVLFLRIPEGNVFVAKPEPDGQPVPNQVQARQPAAVAAAPEGARATGAAGAAGRSGLYRIVAGAAGAGLIAGGLYLVIPKSARAPGPPAGQQLAVSGAKDAAARGRSDGERQVASSVAGEPIATGGPSKQTAERKSPPRERPHAEPTHADGGSSVPRQGPAGAPAPRQATAATSTPQTTPTESQSIAGKPEPAPAAVDLSSLSAKAVSIARRDGGGLRVTVSFRNGAGLPLSVVLDKRSTELSDNQGQRYLVLHSSLPASGSDLRLDLAAGAASTAQFDFPAFKLGSKKFYLALATEDGSALSVAGSPLTLEDPP
jgi:hypothetical protein